jgi:hypothetical protein
MKSLGHRGAISIYLLQMDDLEAFESCGVIEDVGNYRP